jgi:hypothetical protein
MGGILQTADMGNAPYLAIFTHAGAPWTTITQHLRLGNLKGTGDFSSDAYGIFIGDYAGNKWMSYDPTNSLRIRGDAIIDGTIQATMFTNDIGALLFSKADGLLLLGPNCEINDGEWWSLRRQKATISGAFHQEAGRWLGTRGLVVELAGTNLITNPSGETNTTSWAAWLGTVGRTTGEHRFGAYAFTLLATSQTGRAYYTYGAAGATDYTVAVRVKYAGGGNDIRVLFYDVANSQYLGGLTTYHSGSGGWEKLSLTGTTGPIAGNLQVLVRDERASGWTTVHFDGVDLRQAACIGTYIDGAQGHEYAWTGTAHASTSTRAATRLNLDALTGLISGKNAVSFEMWVQAPYDWNETWPLQWAYVLDTRGADNNNRIFLFYDSVDDRFEFYVNGQYRLSPSGITFSAGDWLHLVVTLDFTANACTLYLNGEVVGSGNVGATSAPTLTTWGLCGRYDGAHQGGWRVGEYAVMGQVVTAGEVAAMYALQRPLVDAGAMDRPGIYILDGRFRMASSLTGAHIEITADEIAGYSDAITKEFYLQASDGKAMCGAGAVILDADGIRMVGTGLVDDPRRVLFQDDTSGARTLGWVGAGWGGGGSDPDVMWVVATRDSGDPWPAGIEVDIVAIDTVASTDVRIVVKSNKVVEVYGEDIFKTEKLLRPGTGTADPTAQLEDGCLFYRTDTDKLRLRANGAWVDLN